ncbi:hypothetical protein HYS47_05620 [Candidatus Woesearchaeota archaeon]|nr:hypothetical protein [Candidatus Woesearchaeota archaeon]
MPKGWIRYGNYVQLPGKKRRFKGVVQPIGGNLRAQHVEANLDGLRTRDFVEFTTGSPGKITAVYERKKARSISKAL